MIEIHINPARVEKVIFVADSDIEESYDFAAWQAIRPFIDQINTRLAQIVESVTQQRLDAE